MKLPTSYSWVSTSDFCIAHCDVLSSSLFGGQHSPQPGKTAHGFIPFYCCSFSFYKAFIIIFIIYMVLLGFCVRIWAKVYLYIQEANRLNSVLSLIACGRVCWSVIHFHSCFINCSKKFQKQVSHFLCI